VLRVVSCDSSLLVLLIPLHSSHMNLSICTCDAMCSSTDAAESNSLIAFTHVSVPLMSVAGKIWRMQCCGMLRSIEGNLRYLFPFPVVWEDWIRGWGRRRGGGTAKVVCYSYIQALNCNSECSGDMELRYSLFMCMSYCKQPYCFCC
jgi:hypothetical protein